MWERTRQSGSGALYVTDIHTRERERERRRVYVQNECNSIQPLHNVVLFVLGAVSVLYRPLRCVLHVFKYIYCA